MKHRTSISIVIPTIGRSSLAMAVESATNQYGACIDEVIVCFDHTENKIFPQNEFIANNTKVKIIHNSRSKGVAGALNHAIESASGDLIAWLSDDDYYSSPIKFLRIINIINRNKLWDIATNSFFYSNFFIFNKNAETHENPFTNALNPYLNYVGGHVENHQFAYQNGYKSVSKGLVNGCAAVFGKNLWRMVNGFPEHAQLQTTQDTVFWLSISEKADLYAYIDGDDSTSVQHGEQGQVTLSDIALVESTRLKSIVQLKNILTLQNSIFNLKEFIKSHLQTYLLDTQPLSILKTPPSHSIGELAKFELKQNTIAIILFTNENPQTQCITNFIENLAKVVGELLEIDDKELYWNEYIFNIYIKTPLKNKKINLSNFEIDDSYQNADMADILSEYRYILTGELLENINQDMSLLKNLKILLEERDLTKYWSFLDSRETYCKEPGEIVVRAPWSHKEKP